MPADAFKVMAAAAAFVWQAAFPALSAEVTFDSLKTSDGRVLPFIFVEGELQSSDVVRFGEVASRVEAAMVVLDSPGGELEAGIDLGRLIARRHYSTAVVDTCASACALAWLAGSEKYAAREARVGFHVAYVGRVLKMESGLGNALVGLYLGELGLGENVVRYVSSAAPDDMQWLTPHDASMLGMRVVLFDAPSRQKLAISKPLLPGTSTPVPGFDTANVARAVKNGLARYRDAGMIGLQESSEACWRVARESRRLDKVQYCRALDLVGIGMNEAGKQTFSLPGTSHFGANARASELTKGFLATGIDDTAVTKKIMRLWQDQFDKEFAKAAL
jgi:hypothetical protein